MSIVLIVYRQLIKRFIYLTLSTAEVSTGYTWPSRSNLQGAAFLNTGKLVGGHVKKSITSPFFNRITFYLAVTCKTFQQINL